MKIEQGFCYLADMNPPRKSKPGKVRPVLVIQSSDTIEAGSPGIVVVPLATNVKDENILRVHIRLHADLKLKKASDALVDQIHTLDHTLFLEELGPIKQDDFEKVSRGIEFLLKR